MKFLSRLIPKSSPSAQKNVVALSPGEFYIVRREDSPQGHRELIFKDAELTLIASNREFFPQIKITDLAAQEEDDEAGGDSQHSIEAGELLDVEFEEDNTYLVHRDIKLGYYLSNGRVAVAWQDMEGEEGDRFEFLCAESVSKEALDRFDTAVGTAMYGQKYGTKPPADAPPTIFEEFIYDYEKQNQQLHSPSKIEAPTKSAAQPKEEATTTTSTAETTTTDSSEKELETAYDFSKGRIMTSADCDLCAYDSVQGVFVLPKHLQGLQAVILDQNDYNYFLEVRNSKSALLGTPVHDDLNTYVDAANRALIFNYEGENNVVMSYLLRFRDQETLYAFEKVLAVAQWETSNRARWGDVPEDQQSYLMDAMNGFNMDEDRYEEDGEEIEDEDDDDEMVDVESEDPTKGDHGRNSALEVGHVNDRTYVVRGNQIGVFKNTDRDLEYSTTIKSVQFDPSHIMLHEQDRALVLQGEDDPDRLYRMDLETGKIVNEWDVGHEVLDFNPVSKFAQTTAETNLVGVASKRIFRIDPRISNGGAGDSSIGTGRTLRSTRVARADPNAGNVGIAAQKSYGSKMNFTNVATTAAGYLVVGNKRGELRLYDQLGKVAKTLIPGLGDAFIGLDVTSDGHYILATCERYLLLIDAANEDQNGFLKALGQGARAKPIKLTISPENATFMRQQTGQRVKFTTARFNTGVDSKEATIVTSTGPYLVIWNLNRVLRGETHAYRIKKYDSEITSENFKFGTDRRVILTLEDDVNMVAKSALKSPDSIFKPRKK